MKWRTSVFAAVLGIVAAVASDAEPLSRPPASGLDRATAAVRRTLPGTEITAVRLSPVPGLVEVAAGANVLYADSTGRWLVIGHLYDLVTATDVTAERLVATAARLAWADLPFDAAVRFGSGPLELGVFLDPDGPWCRKLHAELRRSSGIAVHELMYPLPALHPDARRKAIEILCAADPASALDRIMAGGEIVPRAGAPDCAVDARAAVERAMAYGEKIAVRGTPTLVAPDGRTHAGYLPLQEIEAWLRVGQSDRADVR